MTPFEHADLDDGTRHARLDERVKGLVVKVGQMESDHAKLADEVRMLERKHVRSEIANNLVFAICGLILITFFGVVTAYFIGRPPGAPVSIRSSEGVR